MAIGERLAFRDAGPGLTFCVLCGHEVKVPHVPQRRYVWRRAWVGVLHSAQRRHLTKCHPNDWAWAQGDRFPTGRPGRMVVREDFIGPLVWWATRPRPARQGV